MQNTKELIERENLIQGRNIIECVLTSEEPFIRLDDGTQLYLDECERD